MKLMKLCILFTLFLTISIFSLNCATAEDSNLKIQLGIYEPANGDGKLDYEKDILLSLEIINNNNYWVSIGNSYNSNPYLTLDIKNRDENEIYRYHFANNILIPPSETHTVLIPFDYYNKMAVEERIDSWNIKPEFYIDSVKYYNSPFEATETHPNYPFSSSESSIVGNMLSFYVEDPNALLIDRNNGENSIIVKVEEYINKEDKTIYDGIFITVVGGVLLVAVLWVGKSIIIPFVKK
jgi:hypothetical protein